MYGITAKHTFYGYLPKVYNLPEVTSSSRLISKLDGLSAIRKPSVPYSNLIITVWQINEEGKFHYHLVHFAQNMGSKM